MLTVDFSWWRTSYHNRPDSNAYSWFSVQRCGGSCSPLFTRSTLALEGTPPVTYCGGCRMESWRTFAPRWDEPANRKADEDSIMRPHWCPQFHISHTLTSEFCDFHVDLELFLHKCKFQHWPRQKSMLFNFFVKLDIHPFGLIALKKPKMSLNCVVSHMLCHSLWYKFCRVGRV